MPHISLSLPDRKLIWNDKQADYLTALFNPDFTIRTDNNFNEFAFFGGFRSGKSFCEQFSVWQICLKYPNTRALYVRDTYAQLQDSVIQQFRNDFERYGQFIYKLSDRECHFKNGSIIKFRAFDRDTNILSAEYDLIAVCQAEDIKQELFLQLFGRLSGNNLPKRLLLTEGNPANTFVKTRYKDASIAELIQKKIFFVEAPTADNAKNLDADYMQRLKDTYPANWFNRYVLGGWEQIDEMVFSEFREADHFIIPSLPSKSEEKAIGGDYGYRTPSAFVWVYKDYDGNYIVYDEWGGTEKTPEELAEANKKHGQLITVMDYSIKRPGSHGKSLWDKLVEYGLILFESNKDELRNILVVNTLFKQGKLKIGKNCPELKKEILNYKWKRLKLGAESNLPEQAVDKDNHYIDALLYVIAFMEDQDSIKPQAVPYEQTIEYWASDPIADFDINDRG